jgi:hypothetical protein
LSKNKAKKAPPYLYDGPPPSHEDRPEETLDETEDIYDAKQRESMIEEDDITPAEGGFMEGFTQEPPSKKETRKNAISHTDEVADELAKEDAEDS